MTRSTKVAIVASVAVLPALLWAFSRGPDPRATGAPGDGTCANTGCHVGTPVNGGGGSVALSFSSGTTYTPGQTVRVTVTITQANPVPRAYGFQLSARLASDTRNGQAGDFRVGSGMVVLCDNGNTKPAASPCPAAAPVQFAEHSTPSATGRWELDWVAPAANVGDVIFYVAGNAANGDGSSAGDRIYTSNARLRPSCGRGLTTRPEIAAGGVISAGAYGGGSRAASGSWIEIYGRNFTNTTETCTWDGGFLNGAAPTTLDQLSVTVNNKPAFLWFATSGQINVQVPDDGDTGPVAVRVKRGDQESEPVSITKQATAPGLLAPASFLINNRQFVGAVFATAPGTFAGNNLPGVPSRLPRPGDILTFYGVGFGAVNPAVPAGRITPGLNELVSRVEFRFGQAPGTITYQGLAPNFVGLYQFNVTVPQAPAGVVQLNVTQGGQAIPQTLFIEIGN